MKVMLRTSVIVIALMVFLGLPILFYWLGEFPRRSVLKEAISLLTLLAFSLMLSQFFMARSNLKVIQLFDLRQVQLVHKFIAYAVMTVLLLHPVLIVFPRLFEAGIGPWQAFRTMLTTFENPGILLGLAAWILLLVLTLTAIFRLRLNWALGIKYRNWRYFHGLLSVLVTAVAVLHAIKLGRHFNPSMVFFSVSVAITGAAMLFKMYLFPPTKPTVSAKQTVGSE
ncbi:ferric reductase-like transmembrane domain-containing protein [Roseibium polysiphoniae]|uniref:Ferric reductase-like transmembrane domain-containing protein n=1 Tax=Roseibium polysiphoniae TaxID=2571221 RepID=A0ABR9CAK7_9HYPH|nr:ferric reductase-like transmembrane domain-containing protein [Roseibium polysiphoniae]MBD8876589.1 ferric reductase-like transmembrane domain-containing protein [Roseibium polysiphoniae]